MAGQMLNKMNRKAQPPPTGPPDLVHESENSKRSRNPRFLTSFSTATPYLVTPNVYECGISALCFCLGTPPPMLGLDIEKWRGADLSRNYKMRFSFLNELLNQCKGGGKAISLTKTMMDVYAVLLLRTVSLYRPLPSFMRTPTHTFTHTPSPTPIHVVCLVVVCAGWYVHGPCPLR